MTKSEAVEPKEGMPVEHGNGGKSAEKLKVARVDPVKKTFHLDTESGDPYTFQPAPFKELAKVGEKVIWNHD